MKKYVGSENILNFTIIPDISISTINPITFIFVYVTPCLFDRILNSETI